MKRRQKDKAGSKRKARPAKKKPKPGLPYTVMKDAPPSYAPESKPKGKKIELTLDESVGTEEG